MMLVVVSILLTGTRVIFSESMVIYAQTAKLYFPQVFFPIDGAYGEESSERSALFENLTKGVKIYFPPTTADHVRIDPANEATEVVITKIELQYPFGTETLLPNDLLARVEPIQMIDKLEVTPAGFLIRTTGNDSAFKLKLNRPSALSQSIILCIIVVLLSLAIFLVRKKVSHLNLPSVSSRIYLVTVPLLIALGVATLFYPGFMSYDTLHALRSARVGVTDSMWPPMVSYVWRAVDLLSVNPSAMHFSQIFILLSSIFYIVFSFTKKVRYATAFLLIYLMIPSVLGTMAVIWKDVLMAAFFLAGFAVISAMAHVTSKSKFTLLSLLAVFLIFLGVCSRHNAITGAVPLFFYLAFTICSRLIMRPSRLWAIVFLLGSALTGAVFITKIQLDNYSLPGFQRLSNSNDIFIQSVRALDVAGASLCVGNNLFADMAPNLSLAEIKSGYDPRHINLSKGLLDAVGVDGRIDKVWLNVAARHPVCFFSHKLNLTKYMMGGNRGVQFLITAPSIDKNEYGYLLAKSSIRDLAVRYIVRASEMPFLKPWFLYLLSIGSFIYLVCTKALTVGHSVIFSSAIFYFGGLVIFGNAADARLLFYTTTALSIFIFISILEPKKRHQ